MSRVKKVFAVACSSAMLAVGAAAPASAANNSVDVSIGNLVTIQDVNVAVGAQVAAALCNTSVTVAALVGDFNQGNDYTCTIDGGSADGQTLTIKQA